MTSRLGPVSVEAVDDLIGAADACIGSALPTDRFIDRAAACRNARAFKLDVSFALTRDGRRSARFSVNDKGEPEAFRSRLFAGCDALEISGAQLQAQLAISPPGEVQTTLGVKWGPEAGPPERVSLYFEELMRSPRALAIREKMFALGGAEPPKAVAGTELVAVCLDYSHGALVAIKDYWMLTEHPNTKTTQLPMELDAYREGFAFHPVNLTRRFMLASRIRPGGTVAGSKLLWMSEVHRSEDVAWAWREADRVRAGLGGPVGQVLDDLTLRWRHAPGVFLYPDLVSLNTDAAGTPEGVLIYVSIR